MSVRALVLLGTALFAVACKTVTTTTTTVSGTPVVKPVPAPPYDPAGKWTIGIVAQGQPMDVLLELTKLPDGTYSGTITSQYFPPIGISKGILTGKQLSVGFTSPTGEAGTMSLLFDGDTVEGEWSLPGDGSRVTGKKM